MAMNRYICSDKGGCNLKCKAEIESTLEIIEGSCVMSSAPFPLKLVTWERIVEQDVEKFLGGFDNVQ